MKAGKYTIKELFVNSYIDQIIIPEIQRDYVWGPEQTNGLLGSILDDYNQFINAKVPVQTSDDQIKELFEQFYKKQRYSTNIGFIYAYNDPEYTGKYFLIDGQQRVTTIYLLLLALAVNQDKALFEKYYFPGGKLKIDYRVRDSAHSFLKSFVQHILEGKDASEETIINQYWYFSPYKIDKTIPSLIANYSTISSFLKANNLYNAAFFEYVQNYIEFWYFDTNMSDQGEELYIYMNARGEQIQPNENLKADLLANVSSEKEKNRWGAKWEEWQDFFWQRRSTNPNADIGFNEFINCIAGLEYYLIRMKDDGAVILPFNKLLTLEKVNTYVNALKVLESNIGSFTAHYSYSSWVQSYYDLIWSYLNKTTGRTADWFADFKDKNKNDDRNNMILLWSMFSYFSTKENFNLEDYFRTLRFFYVRFNNYNRSVSTLRNTVEIITKKGVIDNFENNWVKYDDADEETDLKLKTEEESSKYKFLYQFKENEAELRKYEATIWEIEDHPYCLNGRYLGNINISHLVDLTKNPTLPELQKVRDCFLSLMNFEDKEHQKTLTSLLLHYGPFYMRHTPYYYHNYEFDNWRRIIRGTDGNAFQLLFNEILNSPSPVSLKELLEKKNNEFLAQHINNITSITDFREQLIIYSILWEDELWYSGFHMCYDGEPKQRLFDQEYKIFNTKQYKGGEWYLYDDLIKKHGSRKKILELLQSKTKALAQL